MMTILRKLGVGRWENEHAELGLGSSIHNRLCSCDSVAVTKAWRSHLKNAKLRRVSAPDSSEDRQLREP